MKTIKKIMLLLVLIVGFTPFFNSTHATYTGNNPFVSMVDTTTAGGISASQGIMSSDLGSVIQFLIGFLVIMVIITIIIAVISLKNKNS